MKSFRKNPLSAAEAQEQKFVTAIVKADAKIGIIENEIQKHRAARRAHIVSDPDADVPAVLRNSLDTAERHLVAVREERDDLTVGLEELRAAIAAAKAKDERDAAAKVLEDTAASVAKAGVDLDVAVAGVRRVFRRIVEAIPAAFATYPQDHETRPPGRDSSQFATAHEVASALLAEALFEALPEAFDVVQVRTDTPWGIATSHARNVMLYRMADLAGVPRATFFEDVPRGTNGSAAAGAITTQWRERARAMRAGELVPDPSMIATERPKAPDQGMLDVLVFAIKPFAYVENGRGGRRLCGRRDHHVPGYVADAAVVAGAALRRGTPEGDAAYDKHQSYRETTLTSMDTGLRIEDCIDLGDPCRFLPGPEKLAAAK